MRTTIHRHGSCVAISLLLACGGATPAPETEPPPPAPAPPEVEQEPPPAEPEPEQSEPEQSEPAEPEEAEREPAPPPAPPLTSPSADDIREALLAASSDVVALGRLVDPAWGIGVVEADVGMLQHCDTERLASAPGIGFVFGAGDTFRCDRDLRRCTVQEQDGRGYAFHFREGEGDTVWLNAIVHYDRRVPNTDNARVRAFVGEGDGVCALWRSLRSTDGEVPERLSVFVSSHTGLVPETLAEHRCGDDAAAAHGERVAPLSSSSPERCERDPARCTFDVGDEDVTVYGGEDGPTAVAVTRPGMHRNLERAQQRELDAFLRAASRHDCSEE